MQKRVMCICDRYQEIKIKLNAKFEGNAMQSYGLIDMLTGT